MYKIYAMKHGMAPWCIRKIFIIMRLTTVILLVALMQVRAASFAQRVTLNDRNANLETILKEIRRQTNYDFFYNRKKVQAVGRVDINLKNATVAEALNQLLATLPLTYSIDGQLVSIKDKPSEFVNPPIVAINISGKVVDSDGKPIPNANIRLKSNLEKKAVSKDDGSFTISVPKDKEILVVSYIGFVTKEVVADSKKQPLIIELTTDVISGEEVVVTGIFSRPVENFTGAATTLKGEDLKKVNATDIFKSVAALEPAFNIISNNATGSNINQVPNLQIRGQNSFPTLTDDITNNPNQPLFVLDGFEVNIERIKDLDINLINSIVILKDATATSIYGSRGANGVMVITTKLPQPGKLNINVINDISISTPDLSVYQLLDARQKMDFEQRANVYVDDTGDPNRQYALTQLYNSRLKNVEAGINTDWRKLPVQSGLSNRTSLSIRGGDQVIRYALNELPTCKKVL